MKNIRFCLIFIVLVLLCGCTNTKNTSQEKSLTLDEKIEKPLQELFDEYIENEDFEGIKSLKGKFISYDLAQIDNDRLSSHVIFFRQWFDTETYWRDPSICFYQNNIKQNFAIFYLDYAMVTKGKKPEGYKGADTQINEIALLKCDEGYKFHLYGACKYNEDGEIVMAEDVFCLRKSKIYEDGSFEDTTVWYKKIVPDYVIEVLSPEEFVITKGEDSEYFYYYDENHHLVL